MGNMQDQLAKYRTRCQPGKFCDRLGLAYRFCLSCVLIGLLIGVSSCSKKMRDWNCDSNHECDSRVCNADGECVLNAEPVHFETTEMEDAIVGDPNYSQFVQVQGGVTPYEFSLSTQNIELNWLEIDQLSGELRNQEGKTATQLASDLSLEVGVADNSNAGRGQTVKQTFTINIVTCIEDTVCWTPSQGFCNMGLRQCENGMLGPFCNIQEQSDSLEHCGPDCTACTAAADRCEQGLCKCNNADQCQPGLSCCPDGCFDLSSATEHCGNCTTNCSQISHAIDPICQQGLCNYSECEPGYLDCDGSRSNGCETPVSVENCSVCGDNCQDQSNYLHTENHQCLDQTCHYTCQTGWANCQQAARDGCESDLSQPSSCGDCQTSCLDASDGFLCLPTDEASYSCGCTSEQDCPAEHLCCSGKCVEHNENHCASCDHKCSIQSGGLACIKQDDNWECQCTEDDECRGVYLFSRAVCLNTSRCNCLGNQNCAGSLDDMCCLTAGTPGCVDLYSDANNCGICEVVCQPGESCVQGGCTCNAGVCPDDSPAPDCVAGKCVCAYNGNLACQPGQECCLGKGCCINSCDSAQTESCSNFCIAEQDIWCTCGCCPAAQCATQDDCSAYCESL